MFKALQGFEYNIGARPHKGEYLCCSQEFCRIAYSTPISDVA
jgi:hypothetical protein